MGQRCAEQIQSRFAGPSATQRARLMRSSKLNRNQFQSIADTPDGGSRPRSGRLVASAAFGSISVPQQLVDAGFGAGAFVHALDDHSAGGGGAGLAGPP